MTSIGNNNSNLMNKGDGNSSNGVKSNSLAKNYSSGSFANKPLTNNLASNNIGNLGQIGNGPAINAQFQPKSGGTNPMKKSDIQDSAHQPSLLNRYNSSNQSSFNSQQQPNNNK